MDAERLLGAMVRQAMMGGGGAAARRRHRRGYGAGTMLGPGMRGIVGMGALGVAIAAFDHFMRQKTPSAQSFTGAPATPAPPTPAAQLPPLPPLPPPPPAPAVAAKDEEALLMIRAMIAAANADHELDTDERERIVRTMDESGLDASARARLLEELERPLDIPSLVAKATAPQLKRDVYLASEMAISADTKAEQNYLARLASQLGLGQPEVAELRKILEESTEPATGQS